jgi:excisionase family DNA binding protein
MQEGVMNDITVGEAAKILKCHPDTVRRYERRGQLKAKRDYRGFRIFELEEILRVKTQRQKLEEEQRPYGSRNQTEHPQF